MKNNMKLKMTRLEKLVWNNPHASWDQLANLAKTTPAACQRAYDRARAKEIKAGRTTGLIISQ